MVSNKLPLAGPTRAEPTRAYANSYPQADYRNGTYSPTYGVRPAWHQSQRFRIFITTTLLCATLGLIVDFTRPAIYRSSTTLLTVTPDQVGVEVAEASRQHALIQKNLLTARRILDTTLEQASLDSYPRNQLPASSAEFQKMLSVVPLEDTNLIEISAEGHHPEVLPSLLNTLVSAYAQFRSNTIAEAVAETSGSLLEQQTAMAETIVIKRLQLEQFRADNNILSLGEDNNEVSAKLTGLSQALNTAMENRVTTKAELDALRSAAARGQALVAPGDERAFADLQRRQRELRDKLTELDNKYTRDYMALHPAMKSVPEQLEAVNKKIAEQLSSGESLVLSTASRNYQSAKNAEVALQQQLNNYKQTALQFSTQFSAHEAQKEELIQLEEHSRSIQQRITELELEQQHKYPQIKVIEPAYPSSKSIRPLYWRDAGIVLIGSALLGLFAIWLYEFLRRSRPENEGQPPAANYVTVIDPRLITPGEVPTAQASLSSQIHTHAHAKAISPLEQSSGEQNLGEQSATEQGNDNAAPGTMRELSATELSELLAAADLASQQLIALLLSGLRPDELAKLKAEDFSPPANSLAPQQLQLHTGEPRVIVFSKPLQELLEKTQGSPQWLNTEQSLNTEYFNAMLNCAAIDAGLKEPSTIDSTCLHQSYICFLVRSGIKLSELASISGQLSPLELTQYGQLSPPGPGLPAKDITTTHPALREL